MFIARRAAFALLTTVGIAALAGPMAASAPAGVPHTPLIRDSLEASIPSDPMLNGAAPGNVVWALGKGSVVLHNDGRLVVVVDGLVHADHHKTGAVSTVDASLYCNEETTPAATTGQVELTNGGHAEISSTIAVPSRCLAPVVLVHPLGIASVYIAASA